MVTDAISEKHRVFPTLLIKQILHQDEGRNYDSAIMNVQLSIMIVMGRFSSHSRLIGTIYIDNMY